MKATLLNEKDNVAVVLGAVKAGEEITWFRAGVPCSATALRDVPIYHKIAAAPIAKGTPVIKYGEHIGIAAEDIAMGDYVHVHNVLNNREAL